LQEEKNLLKRMEDLQEILTFKFLIIGIALVHANNLFPNRIERTLVLENKTREILELCANREKSSQRFGKNGSALRLHNVGETYLFFPGQKRSMEIPQNGASIVIMSRRNNTCWTQSIPPSRVAIITLCATYHYGLKEVTNQ